MNTYTYVGANPLSNIDLLGLMGGGAGPQPPPVVNVGGCLIGCVTSNINGTEPQASMEATAGGFIEICERPKEPKNGECEKKDKEKPRDCGIYDPKCDNKVQPPGLDIGRKGSGAIVGVAMKADGTICFRVGLYGSLPFPSVEMGGLYSE